MALVRGTPQLLVETDADGGLGFESRDGRTVRVVTRDNHAEEHAAMGAIIGGGPIGYDTSGRVSTNGAWTLTYDTSGRLSSQTNGSKIQAFNYDASGRFTSITET